MDVLGSCVIHDGAVIDPRRRVSGGSECFGIGVEVGFTGAGWWLRFTQTWQSRPVCPDHPLWVGNRESDNPEPGAVVISLGRSSYPIVAKCFVRRSRCDA